MSCMSTMLSVMARFTNGNEPFDWFLPDAPSCILFVMNLGSVSTAIYTTPVISLKYNISFSLPFVRFEIFTSIVVSPLFTF
jgi:hypothetical protein